MAGSLQLGLFTSNDLSCLPLAPHLGPCHVLSCHLRRPLRWLSSPLLVFHVGLPAHSRFLALPSRLIGPLLCARHRAHRPRCPPSCRRSCSGGGGLTRAVGMIRPGKVAAGAQGGLSRSTRTSLPEGITLLRRQPALPAQAAAPSSLRSQGRGPAPAAVTQGAI